MIQQQWLGYIGCIGLSLYRVMRWKLLFDGEGMTLFIVEGVNLSRRIFLDVEISKFLAVGQYSSPSQGFP